MKKTKLVLFVALACVLLLALTACEGLIDPPDTAKSRVIGGTVLAEGVACQGAEVEVRSTTYKATTDSDGKFAITLSEQDSAADSYTLVVKKQGYLEKIVTVASSDFVADKANVDIALSSEYITLSGAVTSGNQPLAGVKVSVSCDEATALTDENGRFDLQIARPIEQFTVSFGKQFYDTVQKIVDDFANKDVVIDAEMHKTSLAVQGNVEHYFYGGLQDVSVAVEGTDYATSTDAEGNFTVADITDIELPYTLVLSKDGYQTKKISVSDKNATVAAELVSAPVSLGVISPSNKAYNAEVVRDGSGIHFYLTSAQQFVDGDKMCIYIDVNDSGEQLAGSSVIEFALLGNNNAADAICLLWNLKKGQSVTETAEILWGSEVSYTLTNDADGAKIHAFISYDTFAKAGDEFAVTSKSVVGITFFDRSNGADGACGWDRTDLVGVDGAAWVNPENPRDYVRLAPENVIYEAADNTYVRYGNYTVNIIVKDTDGQTVEAVVKAVYSGTETLAQADGKYVYVLGGINFNRVARLEVSADGYITQNVVVGRDLFRDGIADIEVRLEKAPDVLADKGTVTYYGGALEGAIVSVKGFDGTVTTDGEGKYDLSSLQIELGTASGYTLIFAKQGYKTLEKTVSVGESVSVYMTNEARNLGKFGKYGWDVTIDRNETHLVIDLVSEHNWYGNKDLDGADTVTENELQIYFVTDLSQKAKTVDGLRELTIVEKQLRGGDNWAGWRDGNRDFLAWPGIAYSVVNDDNGCRVHVEVAYQLLGIGKADTVGLSFGEWYGQSAAAWTCAFYDGATQKFVDGGWACDINNPSTSLHWAADNSTKVEYVA